MTRDVSPSTQAALPRRGPCPHLGYNPDRWRDAKVSRRQQRRGDGRGAYTNRVRIERVKGPIQHAYLQPFTEPIRFGVHGAIKQFYGVEPDEELPATASRCLDDSGSDGRPYVF